MAELKKLGERAAKPKTKITKSQTKESSSGKMSIAETRELLQKTQDELEKIKSSAWCHLCGAFKQKLNFYIDSDPLSKTGTSRICRECANKLAYRVGDDGVRQDPTKESVILALRYLNKPFYNKVWESSIQESQNLIIQKNLSNVWTSYIKNISMINYKGRTFADSDIFNTNAAPTKAEQEKKPIKQSKEMKQALKQNREDVLRLMGYDPFENENPEDLPFLYANMVGYLDTSGLAGRDQLKQSSIVEIVKYFNHANKLNDILSRLMSDEINIETNISTIRSLESTKKDITSSILGLAKDNGISLNHSKNASKGEDTWTGMVKKLKDLDLREQEVNMYDITYSDGLSQVANLSDAAILKQIALDENDYNGMLIDARKTINDLQKKADTNEELARKLLRENLDLKDTLKEHGVNIKGGDG